MNDFLSWLQPKPHPDFICVDVFFVEQPANRSPTLYANIHGHFIEVLIQATPFIYRQTMMYVDRYYEKKNWNKKYPKILKELQKRGIITNYELSARISVVGQGKESEPFLIEHLQRRYGPILILEQNRKNYKTWEGVLL